MKYIPTLLPAIVFTVQLSPIQASGPAEDRVRFTRNQGQWEEAVLFKASVNAATVFFEREGATWIRLEDLVHDRVHEAGEEGHGLEPLNAHAWRMRFVGPSANLTVEVGEQRPGYENFFLGNDARRWRSRVPAFKGVRYKGVWPGVDVEYRTVGGDLKYDVLLAPGADPAQVAMAYEGADGMTINVDGELVLQTSVGEVKELAPVAFYSDGAHEAVTCRYRLH
ncbi:MAG TPA: hypothetical protein PLL57_06340, partial [Flavobacteriales bacterium]|nr:hypothetical protein [Flavobacteriales bacterium]